MEKVDRHPRTKFISDIQKRSFSTASTLSFSVSEVQNVECWCNIFEMSDGRQQRTLQCPVPGWEHLLNEPQFKSEEAVISPGQLVRKPLGVERNFSAICPEHGECWVAESGHHISSPNTVGYEVDATWQEIAFAVRNVDRKF
jgi:hypothetical protein